MGIGGLLLVAASAIACVGSSLKMPALLRAARTLSGHARVGPLRASAEPEAPALSFALLVPARKEGQVLERTLLRMADLRYERMRVLPIVGADDRPTHEAAHRAARARPGRVVVQLEPPETSSKPRALNAALAACTEDIIGIFDADGIVHEDLLIHANRLFTRHELDALQLGNQPSAHRPRWYQRHNIVEFSCMFLASAVEAPQPGKLVRLSGNSVFLRRSTLRRLGGWNEGSLAEDCELSMRLAAARARTMVWYRAELATIEESPRGLGPFVRQRSRWNQGFGQILVSGAWLAVPGRQKITAVRFLLEAPLRAIALAMGVVGLVLTWHHPVALVALAPAAALGLCNTVLLTRLHARLPPGIAAPGTASAGLLLGALPFQLLLCVAATRAVARLVIGINTWDKTVHTGGVGPSERVS